MSDSESDEEMTETASRLDSALGSVDDATDSEEPTAGDEQEEQPGSDSSAFVEGIQHGLRTGLFESLGMDDDGSTGDGLGEQFGHLLGEMVVRKLTQQLRRSQNGETETDADDLLDPTELLQREGDESLSDDTVLSEAIDDIEDGRRVIEESGDLLETVDISELPAAIDASEIPEAVDFEEVPAAIANADPERAVELKQLASLVDFGDLWDAVDVREFMRNKDDLEDAVGDITSDDGDSEETDDSSLMDSLGSSDASVSSSDGDDEDSGGELGGGQAQAMEVAIQSKLHDAVEEFRESALDARDQLKAARDEAQETVEEKTGGGTGQPTSRNPTAYSTMVSGWKAGGWSSATFSTVPKDTQHSSAPGHFRIYGRRFENREDDDE